MPAIIFNDGKLDISLNETYEELGAQALDSQDGDITKYILIKDNIMLRALAPDPITILLDSFINILLILSSLENP